MKGFKLKLKDCIGIKTGPMTARLTNDPNRSENFMPMGVVTGDIKVNGKRTGSVTVGVSRVHCYIGVGRRGSLPEAWSVSILDVFRAVHEAVLKRRKEQCGKAKAIKKPKKAARRRK